MSHYFQQERTEQTEMKNSVSVSSCSIIMNRVLREPLLHFLVLGAVLFVIASMARDPAGGRDDQIVVTTGKVEQLIEGWLRTWQRPPTQAELDGLIRDYVREEVYYREALALGLDRDDIVIRRRLRQKLEFISEDVTAQTEPSDDELRAYLQAHPESFRVERRYTFSQIYFNPERHGDALASNMAELLAKLNRAGAKADIAVLGDPSLLEQELSGVPAEEVVKLFGEQFQAKLDELPTGRWQGPVESGYGIHLILISTRTEARLPGLDEVRDAVRREWANRRRLEVNEKFYQALLERYSVTIEQPKPANQLVEAK